MLTVHRVGKTYGGLQALSGVTLAVAEGEILGLVGPNGSGKSTLLNLLSGFARPDSGSIDFAGADIGGRAPWDIAHLGIRRTFQTAAQPEHLSVMEVMLAGAATPIGASVLKGIVCKRAARREEGAAVEMARKLLDSFGLEGQADAEASRLSGGQQKLLSIAAALMGKPRLLLLDEPTAGVNPTLRIQIAKHLRNLQTGGMTIVIVEHDMRFIASTCTRVYVLDKGNVLTDCHPSELAANERVLEAYLGRSAIVAQRGGSAAK